ncbi:MAG: response regulator transcription factor [Chloroflexi bacterium]|nr:response regulator transcription factor [Chloroflexota bacterium]
MTLAHTSVVVIESHPLMRAALCAAIADEPDMTIAAISADGHDILAMADALHPDVILFALGTAEAGDLDALKGLREKLPHASILALMSEESTGLEQAALEHGARAILTKAATRSDLLGALRKLILANH